VRDTTDAIAAYGYSATFLTRNLKILPAVQMIDLTSDLADLQISTSDYRQASALEAVASDGHVKEALAHSKKAFFLCVVKNVVGIASAILGFVVLATGAPLMPSIAWILISLLATVIAIRADVIKSTGRYKVIDFDRKWAVV
jgi:hypothetical protein